MTTGQNGGKTRKRKIVPKIINKKTEALPHLIVEIKKGESRRNRSFGPGTQILIS